MNFDLTEDEEMLKAVAERFVTDRYNGAGPREALANPNGYCTENWALLGELGLVGMAFDADSGGLSASPTDLAVVFEALGCGLVVEPLIESVLVAGKIFEGHAADDLKSAWMDDLLTGTRRLALAHKEPRACGNDCWVETRAVETAAGWKLTGQKSMVRAGAGADGFIVSARVSGDAGDSDDIRLFLVADGADGLSRKAYRLIDGTAACELQLHDVAAQPMDGGIAAITKAETRANVARCAEAVGIMDMLFAVTLEYLRTRQQFGVALGSFQALQHRMVAQYAAIEQARSLLYLAVIQCESDPSAIAGARAFIAEASIILGHEMIQMHGGMGVTDELLIGYGHKRLVMLSRYPENGDSALDRYAGLSAV